MNWLAFLLFFTGFVINIGCLGVLLFEFYRVGHNLIRELLGLYGALAGQTLSLFIGRIIPMDNSMVMVVFQLFLTLILIFIIRLCCFFDAAFIKLKRPSLLTLILLPVTFVVDIRFSAEKWIINLIHFAMIIPITLIFATLLIKLKEIKKRDAFERMLYRLMMIPLLYVPAVVIIYIVLFAVMDLSSVPAPVIMLRDAVSLINLGLGIMCLPVFSYVKALRGESLEELKFSKTDLLQSGLYGLSPREKEIGEMLLSGFSYKEIADNLFISLSTVKTHINNVYRKTDVSSRKELRRKMTRA